MASAIGCSPLVARPQILVADADGFRAQATVDPAEPVLAGHYPGFPIFPGVCLVEQVRLAALAVLPETAEGWQLTAVESCRFLSLVLPGDTLSIDATWTADGAGRGCSAVLAGERGVVARLRVRLEPGAASAADVESR